MKSKITFTYCVVASLLILIESNCYTQNDTLTVKKARTIKISLTEMVVSKYMPKVGVQIGEGIANQNVVNISYKNIRMLGFSNYGIPEKEFNAFILGASYYKNILVKSTGISVANSLGVNKYLFPVAELDNWLIEDFLFIKNKVHFTLLYSHVFENDPIPHGDRLFVIAEVPFDTKRGECSINFSPGISTAFHKNFYNKKGFAHITTSLKNKIVVKRIIVVSFINYQYSLDGIGELQKNVLYGGLGFIYSLN